MRNLSNYLKGISSIILGTAILTSFSINNKVTICHKNKHTVHVSENAIPGHLGHGDRIGKCKNDWLD